MAKINDVVPYWRKGCKVNKKGDVLCPNCEKNLAIVTEYGGIQFCEECKLENSQHIGVFVITSATGDYKTMDRGHAKDIASRVIADDGQTVLKGKKGLDYMASHAKDNPGYARRLAEYKKL